MTTTLKRFLEESEPGTEDNLVKHLPATILSRIFEFGASTVREAIDITCVSLDWRFAARRSRLSLVGDGIKLTDLGALSCSNAFSRLQRLCITSAIFNDGLRALTTIIGLQHLALDGCANITDFRFLRRTKLW